MQRSRIDQFRLGGNPYIEQMAVTAGGDLQIDRRYDFIGHPFFTNEGRPGCVQHQLPHPAGDRLPAKCKGEQTVIRGLIRLLAIVLHGSCFRTASAVLLRSRDIDHVQKLLFSNQLAVITEFNNYRQAQPLYQAIGQLTGLHLQIGDDHDPVIGIDFRANLPLTRLRIRNGQHVVSLIAMPAHRGGCAVGLEYLAIGRHHLCLLGAGFAKHQ
ncbi:MAG: hypothetical protein B6D72_00490 [gamma proteobacterium symbiont of Ctena orbiculata]|nr:MAG: hypothetical protein B6D72_00490 [gamma proteobacterium symbiont of Ctena orbiculata]